ncbi:MAG: ribonuclease HII [Hyphomicrobiales bacterium]|nr:ribonuclease HII [Hyphomicrobiales bacterium]
MARQIGKTVRSPCWKTEAELAGCRENEGLIAGVDEAGRGPWAGPVVAAAVIFRDGVRLDGLDDSKKLKVARREELYEQIFESAIVGVSIISVDEIDRINILQATMAAMRNAIEQLAAPGATVLVDGNRCPKLTQKAVPVVNGDALCPSIAAASIVAKVTRDRLMRELGKDFPQYGWCDNKGYGTSAHSKAIAAFGVTPHHRRSFAPIRAALERKTTIVAPVS